MSRYFLSTGGGLSTWNKGIPANVTLSAWVRIPTAISVARAILSVKASGASATKRDGWTLDTDSSGRIVFSTGSSTSSSSATSLLGDGFLGRVGHWVHVAGIDFGILRTVYANGISLNFTFFTIAPTNSPAYVTVGSEWFSSALNNPWQGNIYWPAVWNKALAADELIALAAGANPKTISPGNLAYFAESPLNAAFDRNYPTGMDLTTNYSGVPYVDAIPPQVQLRTTTKTAKVYLFPSGASGVLVTPTGEEATGSVGTVVPIGNASTAPTGLSATGSVGTVTVVTTANISVAVTGLSATGAVGTPTVIIPGTVQTTGQKLVSLSGLSGVSAGTHLVALGGTGATAGDLLASASPLTTATAIAHLQAITRGVSVTGVSATGFVGTVDVFTPSSVDVFPTGVSATSAVGTATVRGDATIVLTGLDATGAVGAVDVATPGTVTVVVTGLAATGFVSTVTVNVRTNVFPDGVSATGDVGAVGFSLGNVTDVSGIFASGEVGLVAASGASVFAATGISCLGEVGSVGAFAGVIISLTGESVFGFVGDVDLTGTANVVLTGSQATGIAGKAIITPGWDPVDDTQGPNWNPVDDAQTPNWTEIAA